jgi:hypothetical protein
MIDTTLRSTPPLGRVAAALTRATGVALRGPAHAAAALVALATLLLALDVSNGQGTIAFHPEHHVLPGVVGLLLPIAVWMGDDRFGAAFLWTLPVDRRVHSLVKVFAGWLWLMAVVALLVLWLLALVIFTGGNVLGEETRRMLPAFTTAAVVDPSDVQHVRWTPQPVLWLVPFSAATVSYLFASALTLGAPHPLRWIVAAIFVVLVLVGLTEAADLERLFEGVDRLTKALLYGPYGIDAVLTARTESQQVSATLSTGETLVVWRALPNVSQWAVATLLWTSAATIAVVAAASRHSERR